MKVQRNRRNVPLTKEQAKVVEDNYPLAFEALNKFAHKFGKDDEMLSAAFEGLMIASRNFEESKGFKFSTYAMKCMYWIMRRTKFSSSVIKIPIRIAERKQGWTHKRGHTIISLSGPHGDESQLNEIMTHDDEPPVAAARAETIRIVHAAIDQLSVPQQDVMRFHLDGLTMMNVAAIQGIHKDCVLKKRNRAKKNLRKILGPLAAHVG